MKNLEAYNEDCFIVHTNAIESKEDDDLKLRLAKLENVIRAHYKNYDDQFDANNIYSIVPDHTIPTIEHTLANKSIVTAKDDLLSLYSYQSKVIRTLREKILDQQISTIINTCQNCTVTPISTMDHILPKSLFPEFVVNPRNLFPCCGICNGYKLASTTKDKKRLFLNLYLDELPTEQYLFSSISIDKDGEIEYDLHLKNNGKIDASMFELISTHYKRLRLFERMKIKEIERFGEFKNGIVKYAKKLGYDATMEVELEKVEDHKIAYGNNHWQSTIEEAVLRSDIFKTYVESKIVK